MSKINGGVQMSKKTIEEVAKNIWEYAEIRFKEYKSAE